MEDQKENIKYFNDIIKSSEDKRLYRALELGNELKVLLISDSTTDKSAASLSVNVGHIQNPDDIPGLAHFCEHMLFLGTEKYPSENEYKKFISEHGGYCNAETALDYTKFYFDVTPKHLEGALDRFSQFFISPFFAENMVEREVNAVNSEHEENLSLDYWRLCQLEKHTSRKDHPFSKFGTGNRKTLMETPKENGLDVREELLKFHKKWYSANLMTLAVLGKENLEQLEEMIIPLFSNIENKNVETPEWLEHPLGPNELQTKIYVVPIQDSRELNIEFPIPDLSVHYKRQPFRYLSELIGHEGPGSILSSLKAKGWCDSLNAGETTGGKGFSFFNIDSELTEEGMEHVDDIITLVFQYIQMLRELGPQQWFFDEHRKLSETHFRFTDKRDPIDYVTGCVDSLQFCAKYDVPIEEVLSMGFHFIELNPDLVEMGLEYLKPSNSRIAIIGQKFEPIATEIEPLYGTKFKLEKIPEETIQKWENCGLCDELKLPNVNEFIPSNFDISFDGNKDNSTPHPTIIQKSDLIKVWYKQDDQFLLPKAMLRFEFVSPLARLDAVNYNLTYMFTMLVTDALEEYSYAAQLSGLRYFIDNNIYGVWLLVSGYNDKLHVLLDKVLEKMTELKVDVQRFAILKETYVRNLKNYEQMEPHEQASCNLLELISEQAYSIAELSQATSELTFENLHDFLPRLLSKLHIECLIHGNISKEEALSLVRIVENRLNRNEMVKPLLSKQLFKCRGVRLAEGSHFKHVSTNKYHKNSCSSIYYQCEAPTTQINMLTALLVQIIEEPCFNTLRTKEQLGYTVLVSGISLDSNIAVGIQILVQSKKHPNFLDQRIEAFLIHMRDLIVEMSVEDFEKNKESLAALCLEKPKNLAVLNEKFWKEIQSQQYHFNRAEDEVAYLRTITKEQLLEFFDNFVKNDSPRQAKLTVHVISQAEGGAGTLPESEILPPVDQPGKPDSPINIEDVALFKSSQALHPLTTGRLNVHD